MKRHTSIALRSSRKTGTEYVLVATALFAAWIALAEDVTITLDAAGNSAFVVQDAQSNFVTTIWADGRIIAGGVSNVASGAGATVSGGGGYDSVTSNTVGNVAVTAFSTVSGGLGNISTSNSWYGTLGGGYFNGVYGLGGTIGGGVYNTAYGAYGAVPGGLDNHASGNYSFAAGRGAVATHAGAFVWGDSTASYVASDIANQFKVRASGGTKIFSDSSAIVGVELLAGGNSWSATSDRNLKENFDTVDHGELLEALDAIPMTTWNMRTQDPSIRHIGPMAQDFYAAFSVGEKDTHISYSDADGVSLAAIQGLYRLLRARDAENEELREAMAALEARLEAIEAGRNTVSAGGAR